MIQRLQLPVNFHGDELISMVMVRDCSFSRGKLTHMDGLYLFFQFKMDDFGS